MRVQKHKISQVCCFHEQETKTGVTHVTNEGKGQKTKGVHSTDAFN